MPRPSIGRLAAILVPATLIVLLAGASAAKGKPGSTTNARTVCVDAGHGGSDPGATYRGMQEKTLTLDIAKRLRSLLVSNGYSVVLTRTGDASLSNSDRAAICNKGGADTVLSIHLNASSDPSADYFTVLFGKPHKDQAFADTIWSAYDLSSAAGNGSQPKTDPYQFASGLLLKANAPAALAETVFLSNPDEQRLLADGTGARQQEIAENLYAGLAAWYAR
jgi:N-acetylmuramoyl-L-alanine amidase